METLNKQKCYGGTVGYYRHESAETKTPMRFSVFIPPQAEQHKVPVLFYLSGLTCNEENFTTKAGAFRKAADFGLAIVAPDTSPRGENVPDGEGYDLGLGAGFYVDATQAPYSSNYRMESYVTKELPALLAKEFPQIDVQSAGITGHSMGGHGALTLFFRHPGLYKSVSAFAPICAPSQCPWGEKAFTAYLGPDRNEWKKHDATALAEAVENPEGIPPILIDQGMADNFLHTQLNPTLFEEVCEKRGIRLNLRRQEGYDHSYFFIQTFIGDHLAHHIGMLSHEIHLRLRHKV